MDVCTPASCECETAEFEMTEFEEAVTFGFEVGGWVKAGDVGAGAGTAQDNDDDWGVMTSVSARSLRALRAGEKLGLSERAFS